LNATISAPAAFGGDVFVAPCQLTAGSADLQGFFLPAENRPPEKPTNERENEIMQNNEVEIASLFPSPKNSCEKKIRPVEVIVGGGPDSSYTCRPVASKQSWQLEITEICM
jgi:hypothetical protein